MKHARFLIPLMFVALVAFAFVAEAQTATTSGAGTYGATYRSKLRDIHQIPYAWYSQGSPFQNIVVMGSGDFVVSGTCSPKVTRSVWRNLFTDGAAGRNKNLQGGLYAFKNDGTYIGMRDVCIDGAPIASNSENATCNEGGACEGSTKIIPVDDDRFIREFVGIEPASFGWNRPPIEYKISGSNITMVKRAYRGPVNWDDPNREGSYRLGNLVLAGGGLWGTKETNVDAGQLGRSNVIYTDTGLNEIHEWEIGGSGSFASMNEINALAGVGDYVVGTKTAGRDTTVYVFKAVSASTMDEWKRLEQTGTLPGFAPNYIDPKYDPSNPNRVAFATNFSAGSVNVDIYEATTTTFSKISTTPLTGASGIGGLPYAISGDYILYGTCPIENGSVLPVTNGTADPYKGCKVKILKAGALVGEIVLPKWSGLPLSENAGGTEQAQIISLDDAAQSIAMSSNGTILIGSRWGALYRYTIGGTAVPPGTGGVVPPGAIGFSGLNDVLAFATSYLHLLQALMGNSSISPNTTFGESTTTNPTIQNAFDQALELINSNQ